MEIQRLLDTNRAKRGRFMNELDIHTCSDNSFWGLGVFTLACFKRYGMRISLNAPVIRPCISKFGCHLLFRSVPLRWNYMLIKSHSWKRVAFYEYFWEKMFAFENCYIPVIIYYTKVLRNFKEFRSIHFHYSKICVNISFQY